MSDEFDSEQELRAMLSGLDPMSARVPVESHTSPRARHQLEQIMQNTEYTENVAPMRSRKGKTWLAAAAAVAAIAVGTTVAVNAGGSDNGSVVAQDEPRSVLALTAPGGDATMQMCMRFDVEALKPVPQALAATVVSLDDRTATLDVDHWYKGGTADRVTIGLPPGDISPALIPGVDFEVGKQYLISAFENTVSGCGFSGPNTPEYKKTFDQAFGTWNS